MEKSNNSTFFKDRSIFSLYSNSPEKVSRMNNILDFIKNNPGTTAYQISREMKIAYSQIKSAIRDLEYCSLVYVRVVMINGRPNKKLFAEARE